jgi:hypothetical protein
MTPKHTLSTNGVVTSNTEDPIDSASSFSDKAIGATTWRGRAIRTLTRLGEIAGEFGIYAPTVLEIGPGATHPLFMRLLPEGNKIDWDVSAKVRRALLRPIETGLRHTVAFHELETAEPIEIQNALAHLNPKELIIVDRSPAVLQAVNSLVQSGHLSGQISLVHADIESNRLYLEANVVIALNVITPRTKNPEVALDSLARWVAPTGLLTFTSPFPGLIPDGFEQVETDIFRRL